MHSGMGLTKQVISPRCILVWVWQSKSFLLGAFWYGFDKASRFFSMHSGMGLTKQVISPRCILVWVWKSKSFLLDAFWYGFDKASCFSSMHSGMSLTKQVVSPRYILVWVCTKHVASPRCILIWVWQSKSFLLDAFWYVFDKARRFSSMHSGMGLRKQVVSPRYILVWVCTKQVASPRCILIWVWQSKSFLLDAFWYGFDKASCFSSMHSGMGLTKQVVSPRCILVWVWQSTLFLQFMPIIYLVIEVNNITLQHIDKWQNTDDWKRQCVPNGNWYHRQISLERICLFFSWLCLIIVWQNSIGHHSCLLNR